MAAQIISVDPQKRDDPYVRYKMPEMLMKIESSGNGVKTVLPNIRDVCERLGRPEEIMVKFFGYELGTQSTFVKKDDKFILQGSQLKERIAEKVDAFVVKFVLCQHCRNPETDPFVEGKAVNMNCRGCGKISTISIAERAHGLFFAMYSGKKGALSVQNKGMTQAKSTDDTAVQEEAGDATATAAPVKEMKSVIANDAPAAAIEQDNPIDLLAETLEHTVDQQLQERKVYDLRTQFALDDAFVVRLVYRAAINSASQKDGKPFIAALQKHVELIKRFADKPELQKVIIKESEYHCHNLEKQDKFPMVMKMFLEMNAIKESEFIIWAETEEKAPKPGSKKKPPTPYEVVVDYKAKCAPLVDWIKA